MVGAGSAGATPVPAALAPRRSRLSHRPLLSRAPDGGGIPRGRGRHRRALAPHSPAHTPRGARRGGRARQYGNCARARARCGGADLGLDGNAGARDEDGSSPDLLECDGSARAALEPLRSIRASRGDPRSRPAARALPRGRGVAGLGASHDASPSNGPCLRSRHLYRGGGAGGVAAADRAGLSPHLSVERIDARPAVPRERPDAPIAAAFGP